MKLFNDKKAMTWQVIVFGIIALVVVFLVIYWFSGGGSKAFGEVGKKISGTGDCDGDNVANMFDKCKCDPNIGKELKSGQKCGSSSSDAITECPTDCK
ncbi:hypothetical protein ACFL0E_00645 [Nanoarchaeota archaeon]